MPIIFLEQEPKSAKDLVEDDPKSSGTLADYNGGTITITEIPAGKEKDK